MKLIYPAEFKINKTIIVQDKEYTLGSLDSIYLYSERLEMSPAARDYEDYGSKYKVAPDMLHALLRTKVR